jgi:D-alanyl-lipoteichoic acid acyltransferase DltB (MBOAT superfamily)
VVNLGFLGFFKYYNFFLESFLDAFTLFGTQIQANTLNIILPVGISFYTFQTLSYSIDVYKRKLKPTHDFIAFSAFVSFFPQLVAGPIERATNLLPQFLSKRTFNYQKAVDGMRQILWGLFKKMVVADNCAELTNQIFGSHQSQSGSVLILGAVFFAFQIYGDFSGYSDIAIGTARLFGVDLKRNFNFPYLSRDIAEFWRRWHISLTTWFRDYLYIPLGGSRVSKNKIIRNTLVIFLVSGFWHGANWTFIAWGLYHALLFLPLILLNKNRNKLDTIGQNRIFPRTTEFLQVLLTFALVSFGWIFFRAENIQQAFEYISRIFSFETGYFNLSTMMSGVGTLSNFTILFSFISVVVLIVVEWFQRNKEHGLSMINTRFSWLIYERW